MAGVTLGMLAAQVYRRLPPVKAAFNVTQFFAAIAATVLTASALGGGLPATVPAMGVFWLVNHVLVAIAVAATSTQRLRELLVVSAPLSVVHAAGNNSVGLLAGWLSVHVPLGLLGLVSPLLLLWSSYDQQTRRAEEARLFAELARGQEQASDRSTDMSAQVVVTAAARLFGGADVELVLFVADGPVLYVGDETRRSAPPTSRPGRLRLPVGAAGARRGWGRQRLGGRSILLLRGHRRPRSSARGLRGPVARGCALLRATRVASGQGARRPSGGVAVRRGPQRSARGQGRVGRGRRRGGSGPRRPRRAHAPALTLLRESTARLNRLAATVHAQEQVSDIVEELHAVERAVASLLGGISVAAEPGLGGLAIGDLDDVTNEPRPGEDWTTTGRLDLVEG